MGEISEVTTCGLHTSLAVKMQSSAASNGIVAGDNVKSIIQSDFFSPVSKRKNDENERYIFIDKDAGYYYTQYDFDWERYLRGLTYIATDPVTGNLSLKLPVAVTSRSIPSMAPIAVVSKPFYRE